MASEDYINLLRTKLQLLEIYIQKKSIPYQLLTVINWMFNRHKVCKRSIYLDSFVKNSTIRRPANNYTY